MSFSLVEETAFQYWAQLDCPTSLKLFLLGKAGQWAEVLTAKVEPVHFLDTTDDFARANASVCFLKKNPHIGGFSDSDRLSACMASWRAGEASCYHANERLSEYCMHPLQDSVPAEFLRRARKILLRWLGPCPSDDSDNVGYVDGRLVGVPSAIRPPLSLNQLAGHGPGTTFSSPVRNPTAADKYDDRLTLTSGAVFYLTNIVSSLWGKCLLERATRLGVTPLETIDVVRGNRFAAVPKTARTHRGIAIEPTLNVYYQLAIGRAIRRALRRRAGWDLTTAQEIHRKMASQASRDGSYATIDLSNASDSLCKNLVQVLLHDTPWYDRMCDLRATHTLVDGKWHRLEKFSSMGNGYTFELETCVFACLIAACLQLKGRAGVLGHDFFVYGDDLIVPSDTAKLVIDTLAWVGFKVNSDKSFTDGSFRESCGGDYLRGEPVRAFYLKQDLCYGTQAIYSLYNGAKTCLEICGVSSPWFLDWVRRKLLPPNLRDIGGPDRLGDSVLHGVPPKQRWEKQRGIRWVRTVRWYKPVTHKWGYWSATVRIACRLTGYGDTFGINSRGHRPAEELVWVSNS